MKKEIAEKWVAALRSGEYKQGKEFLRTATDEFCCLGVLCDLAVKNGVIISPRPRGEGRAYEYDGDSISGVSSRTVRTWSGLRDFLGEFFKDELRTGKMSLARMNDNGKTFTEIADIIEKHYEEL